jgi:hypothetical protein
LVVKIIEGELWENNPQKIINSNYYFGSVHEFEFGNVPEQIPKVEMMFGRRVKRFRTIMQTNGPVLFVRTYFTKSNAEEFANLMSRKYKKLSYTLLVLNRTNEFVEEWDIPNVIKVNLDFADNWHAADEQYDVLWENIFNSFQFDLRAVKIAGYV